MIEWKDVNKELPDGKCLVCFQEPFFGVFNLEVESGYYDDEQKVWRFWMSDNLIKTKVTHWSYINEPTGNK